MDTKVKTYRRRAVYYETDCMGIVHHSNYIRWFEEARLFFMDKFGTNYADMEELGIIVPVTDVTCEYKESVHFDEEVEIKTRCIFFNGVRMRFAYEAYFTGTDKLAVKGETGHCFTSRNMMPISIKRKFPEVYEKILSYTDTEKQE